MSKMTDDDFDNLLKFTELASEITRTEDLGVIIDFTCPLCNQSAHAMRNTNNGHLVASCKNCDLFIIE